MISFYSLVAHYLFTLVRVWEADVPHPFISVWGQVKTLVSASVLQVATPVLVDAIAGLVPLRLCEGRRGEGEYLGNTTSTRC